MRDGASEREKRRERERTDNSHRGISVSPNEVNRIISCDIDCWIVTRMLCVTWMRIACTKRRNARASR